jgi:hypothetical protein
MDTVKLVKKQFFCKNRTTNKMGEKEMTQGTD